MRRGEGDHSEEPEVLQEEEAGFQIAEAAEAGEEHEGFRVGEEAALVGEGPLQEEEEVVAEGLAGEDK